MMMTREHNERRALIVRRAKYRRKSESMRAMSNRRWAEIRRENEGRTTEWGGPPDGDLEDLPDAVIA